MRWFVTIGLFFVLNNAFSQSNQKCKWIFLFDTPVLLDSLTILPNSFSFSERVEFDFSVENRTILLEKKSSTDSVKVCFTVLPFLINKEYFTHSNGTQTKTREIPSGNEDLVQGSGLKTAGQISRGLNGGNRQDMSYDSYMDFTISGKLSDNINIEARLFDQNIPYQPEGSSHQLKNFDRVYVKVEGQSAGIWMGDVLLKDSGNHFLKYSRSVMGFSAHVKDSASGFSVGIGMNKGKFASDYFQGMEGNYGPYKITGPRNEPYIIIIAGTERIYLDGELLKRGREFDYIIDYDLAEVTFTPKVIITDYSRVRVDFEYRNLQSMRTVRTAEYSMKRENFSLNFSAFSEKDQKMGAYDLFPGEVVSLMESGVSELDQLTAQPVEYTLGEVSYIQLDTVHLDGINYTIYKLSDQPDLVHFNVDFVYQGPGKGNYVKKFSSGNQVQFQWVAPLKDVPQGQYEPYVHWRSPLKRDVYSSHLKWKLNSLDVLELEGVFSRIDNNLFSEKSEDKLDGFGTKLAFQSGKRPIGGGKRYYWSFLLGGEYHSAGLSLIDPIFEAEFNRNWNRADLNFTENGSELMGKVSFEIRNSENEGFAYSLNTRNKADIIQGVQNSLAVKKKVGKLYYDGYILNTQNDNRDFTGKWIKAKNTWEWRGKYFTPGFNWVTDKNTIFHAVKKDSLISSYQYFDEVSWYIKSKSDSIFSWKADYTQRTNYQPRDGEMAFADHAETVRANFNFTAKQGTWGGTLMHRTLSSQFGRVSNVAGTLNSRFTVLNDLIRVESVFSTLNGYEPRRSFIYVEVPVGQGFYTWVDSNQDKIQQLDEFFEAINQDEKRYIRLFVPGNDRVAVINNDFTLNMSFRMPKEWVGQNSLLNKLSGISGRVSIQSSGKTNAFNPLNRVRSLVQNIGDTLLTGGKRNISSFLTYKGLNGKWVIEQRNLLYSQKSWINTGFETKYRNSEELRLRLNINTIWSWSIFGIVGDNQSVSEVFENRNFSYSQKRGGMDWEIGLKGSRYRFKYEYSEKNTHDSESPLEALIHTLNFSFNQSLTSNLSLMSDNSWYHIVFPSDLNDALAYEIMEGGKPGSNFKWNLGLQHHLKSDVDLYFSYFGRKAPGNNSVHQASFRVTASF